MKLLATVREGYRADIDGLRALAVLSVVLFHIDKSWVPGGFIGVDIFFVISGFLITGNIAQDIERGSFKVTEFYRRRIRRIMPALSVVLLTCLLAGQILFLPDDMQDLAFSAIASQLSLANFYFLFSLDTGYFADDSALHPLLHLWTLGVEEQFYLLWPLALFAVGARGFNRVLIGALFVIAAASFIAAQLIAPEAPMTAYYMLPTRAGQLLAGALCYFLVRQRQSITPFPGWSRELMGWGSLALIAASLIWIDESMPFPGILAIPVTLGSAGLLLVGSLGGSSLSLAGSGLCALCDRRAQPATTGAGLHRHGRAVLDVLPLGRGTGPAHAGQFPPGFPDAFRPAHRRIDAGRHRHPRHGRARRLDAQCGLYPTPRAARTGQSAQHGLALCLPGPLSRP